MSLCQRIKSRFYYLKRRHSTVARRHVEECQADGIVILAMHAISRRSDMMVSPGRSLAI
jgi:hypothetical protein